MSHECDLPYPYLFVDERPGYTPPAPGSIEYELNLRGRSVSIDNPRYDDGVVTQCPQCQTWWVFRRHPTPPGNHGGWVQCITTYKPRWHRVRWRDRSLRRRIRRTQTKNRPVLDLPSPSPRKSRGSWGILDGIEDFFDGVLDWW